MPSNQPAGMALLKVSQVPRFVSSVSEVLKSRIEKKVKGVKKHFVFFVVRPKLERLEII